MSDFHAKPKRRLQHEIYSFLLMMAIPVALASVFPYDAIGYRASEPAAEEPPRCAFVTLTADEERQALAVARAAWQVNAEGVRGLRADLSVGELQPTPMVRVLRARTLGDGVKSGASDYVPSVLPPSVGAREPKALPLSDESAKKPAFSRDELLGIN